MARTNQHNGNTVNLLVAASETGGRFAVIHTREQPGDELPLHIHHNEDEFVYILSGHLTVAVGQNRYDAGPGGSYFLPRGIEHGYAITSAEAQLLVALLPAGLEAFLQSLKNGDEAIDIERLIAQAAGYGLEITGELRSGAP